MKKINKKLLVAIVLLTISIHIQAQKIVRYDLTVTDTIVNYTGKSKKAFAVNGQIPMPTLRFTEGDTAVIYIHNKLKNKNTTSLHWHGLILPNQFDGVDYLTSAPIKSGETVVYKFPMVQNGTYWYHSHTGLQEQDGMYGAFIIDKKEEVKKLPEVTVLLNDWTNANSMDILRRLYFEEDWFSIQKHKIKKGVTQSYLEAIKQGHLGTKVANEWKRMDAMDVSDIYYDLVMVNGKKEDQFSQLKGGDKVKLRIINGGSSSYFWINYSGGKMEIIAADGKDVEPVSVDRFIMGNGETYDVIVTLPENNTSYQLLATTEDRTRSTSIWLGEGEKKPVEPLKPLNYFEGMKMMNGMMKMDGNLDTKGMKMSMQKMDMNAVMYPEITGDSPKEKSSKTKSEEHSSHTIDQHAGHSMDGDKKEMDHPTPTGIKTLNYTMLKSNTPTSLPEGPVREMRFELTGNMNRYVWSINNKTMSETDKILIKKGERVRVTLYNNTMMRHPMHLHGHFFRILNGQGEYSPLKHTMDIMPMETNVIEFEANESGDWIFHCHILYHMMGGMGRVFSYKNSPPNPQLPDTKMSWKMFSMMDKMKRFSIQNEVSSGGNVGRAMLEDKRWALQSEWKLAYKSDPGYEVEARVGRFIGKMQWFMPYAGYKLKYNTGEKEKNIFGQKKEKHTVTLGARYLLPMLIMLDANVSPINGEVEVKLEKENIVLAPRLRMDLALDNHLDFTTRLRYVLTKYISVSGYYDSEWKWGAGLSFRY